MEPNLMRSVFAPRLPDHPRHPHADRPEYEEWRERERHRGDREREPHDQCQCFTRLPVGPPRPHREARAERDRGRDEEAVKGDHTILSNTMSVSSAGKRLTGKSAIA